MLIFTYHRHVIRQRLENVPVAKEETVPHVSAMNTEITSILCSILVAPHQ